MKTAGIAALLIGMTSGFGQEPPTDKTQTYVEELKLNPRSSLAHFRMGEWFFEQHNYQPAANEFREALNGDPHPRWIDAWAHIDIGEIFDATGQASRAIGEYRLAVETKDDTEGAQTLAVQLMDGTLRPKDVTLHRVMERTVVKVRPTTNPEPLLKVPAQYSPEARVAGLEGTVVLAVTVGANGSGEEVRVLESLGLGLDEAAIAAAKLWSFKPGTAESLPARMMASIELPFLLSSEQSRWHLLHLQLGTPEGGLRPHLVGASYPGGDGIGPAAREAARLIGAMGRQASVSLTFDVDKSGRPIHFRVQSATEPVWGNEAIAIVRRWRFSPGSKDGSAVSVPCTLRLVWGEKQFTESSLAWAHEALEQDVTRRESVR